MLDLPNEIGVGLRDPAQLFGFGESAAQAVEPDQYADYQQGKAAVERRLGVDIDEDLIAQLEGDASISVSDRGDVGVRIELADEAKFGDTLAKLEKELPRLISSTGGSRTRLTQRRRRDRAAQRRRRHARLQRGGRRAAARPTSPRAWSSCQASSRSTSTGAKGALVVNADAQELFLEALRAGQQPRRRRLAGHRAGARRPARSPARSTS